QIPPAPRFSEGSSIRTNKRIEEPSAAFSDEWRERLGSNPEQSLRTGRGAADVEADGTWASLDDASSSPAPASQRSVR
ncbi:MAG: hypothetical protein ACTHYJ_11875, partial [Brevibacterium yomogidense]